MTTTSHAPFSLRSIAVPAFGPALLFSIGEGAILPVVALSARDLGASVAVAALIVTLIGLGSWFFNLPASLITLKFGERWAMVGAAAASTVALAAAALSPLLPEGIWLLAAAMVVVGMAASVFSLARQKYLTEAVPVIIRARALSTLGGVNRIGIFIGPFVGALVVAHWGVSAAYVVGFVSSSAALLCVLLVRDITSGHDHRQRLPRRSVAGVLAEHRHTLMTLGVGVLFIAAARACRIALIPLFAESIGLSAAQTSLVVGIAGAVDMLLFYPAGGVMDRYGRMWVALPSMVILAIGMVLLPFAHSFGSLTAAAVVLGLGNGIGAGLVMTLGADASPADARVQFLGGWRLMADLGNAAGPAAISLITIAFPLGVAAVAMGGAAVVGAGWLRAWLPRFDPVVRATSAHRGSSD